MSSVSRHDVSALVTDEGEAQYLTFTLDGEAFAIGILCITEIIEYSNLTAVPMMPPAVRGVINLRGAVVPVVDLMARFGKPATSPGKRTCIVIVEVEDDELTQDIGLMVDTVSEVVEIPADQIEPPPSFGAGLRADFIEGMGKLHGRFVILLNVARVLDLHELDVLDQIDTHLLPAPG